MPPASGTRCVAVGIAGTSTAPLTINAAAMIAFACPSNGSIMASDCASHVRLPPRRPYHCRDRRHDGRAGAATLHSPGAASQSETREMRADDVVALAGGGFEPFSLQD